MYFNLHVISNLKIVTTIKSKVQGELVTLAKIPRSVYPKLERHLFFREELVEIQTINS